MSAYVVDPRTIDYLVAWLMAPNPYSSCAVCTRRIWETPEDVPEELRGSLCVGYKGAFLGMLNLSIMHPSDIGRILMAENIRSVTYRYDAPCGSLDLPGPTEEHESFNRVRAYSYRPIPCSMRADWVVKSCDCLAYQSCETDDYKKTIACAIIEAIREDAINCWTHDSPWGVTDDKLRAPANGRWMAKVAS